MPVAIRVTVTFLAVIDRDTDHDVTAAPSNAAVKLRSRCGHVAVKLRSVLLVIHSQEN